MDCLARKGGITPRLISDLAFSVSRLRFPQFFDLSTAQRCCSAAIYIQGTLSAHSAVRRRELYGGRPRAFCESV